MKIGEINTTQAVVQASRKALTPEISTMRRKVGEKSVLKGSVSWGIQR